MPVEWTSNAQKSWPDGADGVSVAPSGTGGVFGSWVTIVDPTDVDAVLTGIVLRTTSNTDPVIQVQIGVGAAASEVPIATVPGAQHGASSTTDYNDVHWCFAIPVDLIPAGSRVAVRVRLNSTSTTAYLVAANYLEKPIVGNLTVSTQPIQCEPAGTMTQITASGTPWAFGSWAQIVASTSTAQVIDGVAFWLNGTPECEIQIGTGAAAAESAVALFRIVGGITGAFGYLPQMLPLDVIGASARVSARVRSDQASQQVFIGYSYREQPL